MRQENIKQQAQGFLEQIGGRLKCAFGRMFHHEHVEAEGRAEELRGKAEVEGAKTAERREGKVEETAGGVQRTIGETIGSERMATEGRAKETEGQERHVNR